jgi:hypothetical protein
LLFAGSMGSVVVVRSQALLRLNLTELGRYDALARVLFAGWQIYAFANGATPLLLIFTNLEIGFGIAQAPPFRAAAQPVEMRPAPPSPISA